MKFQFMRLAMLMGMALLIAACTGMEKTEDASAGGDDQAAFAQLYQEAEQAYQKVAAVGGAWSETQDRLNEAKQAAEKADYKTAIKLAQRAKFEGDMAYAQYASQKDAGPHLF
jgi:hypothetical protein